MRPTSLSSRALTELMSRTAHGSRETPDKGVVLDPAVAPSKVSPTARQALPLGQKHESLVVASPNGRPFAATDAIKTSGMEPGQMESGQIEPGRAGLAPEQVRALFAEFSAAYARIRDAGPAGG